MTQALTRKLPLPSPDLSNPPFVLIIRPCDNIDDIPSTEAQILGSLALFRPPHVWVQVDSQDGDGAGERHDLLTREGAASGSGTKLQQAD